MRVANFQFYFIFLCMIERVERRTWLSTLGTHSFGLRKRFMCGAYFICNLLRMRAKQNNYVNCEPIDNFQLYCWKHFFSLVSFSLFLYGFRVLIIYCLSDDVVRSLFLRFSLCELREPETYYEIERQSLHISFFCLLLYYFGRFHYLLHYSMFAQ